MDQRHESVAKTKSFFLSHWQGCGQLSVIRLPEKVTAYFIVSLRGHAALNKAS